MARQTNSMKRNQDKTMSDVKSIVAALDFYPDSDFFSLTVQATNPISYLLDLLKIFHVTEEDIIKWLVNFIKYQLPFIELGVKGILLSNLKNIISCSVDPRIPAYARDEGLFFSVSQIDFIGLLKNSPLENDGKFKYFGVTKTIENQNGEKETIYEVSTPYDLLRPKDFNSFLWYIIHRGKYPLPSYVSYQNYEDDLKKFGAISVSGESLYDITILTCDGKGINVGNVLYDKELNTYSVCSNVSYDETGKAVKNTIFPIGKDNKGTNYYVNRQTYFNFLDVSGNMEEKTNVRDFNKDIPLCNFSYIDNKNYNDVNYNNLKLKTNYLNDIIRIKILPKPLLHVPHIGQTNVLPKLITFDCYGNPDSNGRFSIDSNLQCHTKSYTDKLDELKKNLSDKNIDVVKNGFFENDDDYWYYEYGNGKELKMNKDGSYEKIEDLTALQECYPNLTIFEFNYDYIMSMRLYDAKTVSVELINSLMNFNIGVNITQTNNELEGLQKIIGITKKIIESNGYESSDCFFSFSNSEYDKMQHESEIKRAKLIPFGDDFSNNKINSKKLKEGIDEFGDASTLEESVEIFTKIFNDISATIISKKDANEREVRFNLIQNFIEGLMLIIINTLLTPKVILIILINKELCGNNNQKEFTIDSLLKEMLGMIENILKEIMDMIISELFKFVNEQLVKLLIELSEKMIIEQLEKYRFLIMRLLEECKFSFGKRALLPTEIDNVGYADIDNIQTQPTSNEKC